MPRAGAVLLAVFLAGAGVAQETRVEPDRAIGLEKLEKKVGQLVAEERWGLVARLLHEAIVESADRLASRDGVLYVPARDLLVVRLLSLGDEALAAYRQVYDAEARFDFRDARSRRDPGAMARVVAVHFASSVGDEATHWLARHRMDAGRCAAADRLLTSLDPTRDDGGPVHPDRDLGRDDIRRRRAICRRRLAGRAPDAGAPAPVGRVALEPRWALEVPTAGWLARERRLEEMGVLPRVPGPPLPRGPGWAVLERERFGPIDPRLAGGRILGPPRVAGDRYLAGVLGRGGIELVAVDRRTRSVEWRTRVGSGPGRPAGGRERSLAPGAGAERVYWCADDGVLVALDSCDGSVLWAFAYPWIGFEPAFRSPDSPGPPLAPLVAGDRVVFWPSNGEGPLCVDGETGRLLWRGRRRDESIVLGRSGDRVLTGDDRIVARRLVDGEILWSIDRLRILGRAVVDDRLIRVPVHRDGVDGVLVLEPDGREVHFEPSGLRLGDLSLEGNLLVSEGPTHRLAFEWSDEAIDRAPLDARLADDPDDVHALVERGRLLLRVGREAEGTSDLLRASGLPGGFGPVRAMPIDLELLGRGPGAMAQRARRDVERADGRIEAVLERYLEVRRGDPVGWRKAYADALVGIDGRALEAFVGRLIVARLAGSARPDLERALGALPPGVLPPALDLEVAGALLEAGDAEEALERLDRLSRLEGPAGSTRQAIAGRAFDAYLEQVLAREH